MVPDLDVMGERVQSGRLLDNLVLFGRLLRDLGFDVSSSRMISVVQALDHVNIGHRHDFYYALGCLLIRRREEIVLFDLAFAAFWKKPTSARLALNFPRNDRAIFHKKSFSFASPNNSVRADSLSENQSDKKGDNLETLAAKTYSQNELLRRKDFAELGAEEVGEVVQRLADLIWRLGSRKTRRRHPGRGLVLDFRRSLRSNLRYGGELLVWSRKRPKKKPRSLVIIADISGSMEQYTRMLLHFAYFVARGYERSVEAFVFSTRLTRISRQLRNRSVDDAMQEVSESVPDWSGGTRMGEAIKDFNFNWARRLLTRGAVVLMISDGWDRGDPELLHKEMARLHRSCHRLIWLNPLLGSPHYEPLTRGMQAALPSIDDFMPVHNLASLEDLANHLVLLEERPSSDQNRFRRFSRHSTGSVIPRKTNNA
jgi:uncharacterized protein with von Willebrand factor type A (vWA) domain